MIGRRYSGLRLKFVDVKHQLISEIGVTGSDTS
jgi:hypothetical protein